MTRAERETACLLEMLRQEWLEDHDLHNVTVHLDNPPAWFAPPALCPVCDGGINGHDSVTVAAASGEIIACVVY